MKKRTIVMSLGGSIIIPSNKKDVFLIKFRKMLRKHYNKYKFVIVCGGGSIARSYENLLEEEHKTNKEVSLAGIRATRMNAEFVMQVFGKEANAELPYTIKNVQAELHKNKVVVCGSLRFAPDETSDSTAAKVADHLKAEFINMTNVAGLYTEDPKKNPKAKLIPFETWKNFERTALKIHYKPGQHFVLDQKASIRIRKRKIKTYIIGKDVRNLDNFLKGKRFIGTTIASENENNKSD